LVNRDISDNQRGHGGDVVLTFKLARQYRMATAFHLAWTYGIPRIMSSFDFEDGDQGPPKDSKGNLQSPIFNADGSCGGGWVCEHRWKAIANMVKFRNSVRGTSVSKWWDNGDNQIAFSRGARGFIAFNGQVGANMNMRIETDLPVGTYCDVISGGKVAAACSGASFVVGADGFVQVNIPANNVDGFIALTVDARL
jgi:alpha-amylase